METAYESVFIAGAANTVAQSIVWFVLNAGNSGEQVKSDYVAYTLCNQVAVASVHNKQVLFTLRPQQLEDRINAVCHVQYSEDCVYVLSAGDKGFINIWKITHNITKNTLQQQFIQSLASEGKSMSSICAIGGNNHFSVVAADTLGNLFLWVCNGVGGLGEEGEGGIEVEQSNWQLTRTLRFHTAQMPNTLAIHRLTPLANLLVVGSVDAKVHMFVHHMHTGLTAVGKREG
ncbi:hypothetical protein EON65_31075 [archaeon]|nr:MAG: hypothetical protein EON65_31075 [archaeon]